VLQNNFLFFSKTGRERLAALAFAISYQSIALSSNSAPLHRSGFITYLADRSLLQSLETKIIEYGYETTSKALYPSII
jgi:hypothetical protein